jgi:hypothetical protein
MHGKGYLIYSNGNKYWGQFNHDKRHGYGVFILGKGSEWAGNKYAGQWKDDMRHGDGTYTFADGTEYTGKWEFNFMHGQGTMKYYNGAVFAGEWRNGWKYKGKYTLGKDTQWAGNTMMVNGRMIKCTVTVCINIPTATSLRRVER